MNPAPKKFLFFLFFFSAFACSRPEEKIPSGILPKEKMVAILVDIHFAEAAAGINRQFDTASVTVGAYYNYIYKIHHTSAAEITKSFDFYKEHPPLLNSIYENVISEISRKQGESVND